METATYELCEKCEQAMVDAGVVGLTTEELKAQQAGFDFGLALMLLKEGERIARKGWTGKECFIYLVNGNDVPKSKLRNEAALQIADSPLETVRIHSHIDMKAADGSIAVGWTPSQLDMLAEDWVIV